MRNPAMSWISPIKSIRMSVGNRPWFMFRSHIESRKSGLNAEDFHYFVAEVVDYFDGDAAGGGAVEGAGGVAV